MPRLSPTEQWAIVVVDVAGFAAPNRTGAHLMAVREGLYKAIGAAFTEAGIDLSSCEREDRGDGILVLVPAEVPKNLLADPLPDRLVAAVREYNALRTAAGRMKLRVGMHAGDVRRDEHGWVGRAVNDTFRILEAAEAKAALAAFDGELAVIVSDYFYTEVVRDDPANEPDAYRRISAQVKTFSANAWLRMLGSKPTVAQAEADSLGVLDAFSPADMADLRRDLVLAEVPHLATLMSRATGAAIPPPRLTSAWDAFTYLADLGSGPDGVPPALAFLDLLAMELDEPLRGGVLTWVDRQARRLAIGPALAARRQVRASASEVPRLHLTIVMEPDAIDPARYVLSWWRQDDPLVWPPARAGVTLVAGDELELRLDEIVMATEQVWAGEAVTGVIEFVLPRSLLTLPVHQWHKEHSSGAPRPLVLDYQVRLRSLERMRNTHWHRAWRMRWEMALQPGSDRSASNRIYSFGAEDPEERIDVVLRDPHWVGLLMEEPPSPQPQPAAGPDPLTEALRAGLPFICWRSTARAKPARQQIDRLLSGEPSFAELPERYRKALLTEVAGPKDDTPMSDLVVMWDDPNRVIDIDAPAERSQMVGFSRVATLERASSAGLPVPIARIWSPAGEHTRVGQPTAVAFALNGAADPWLPPLIQPVRLRILLDAGDAAATPVTHRTWLATDRTTPPVTFTVTPTVAATVALTFRVYRESDSQLLMEVAAQLPVVEPTWKPIG